MWVSPGGGVDGEEPAAALRRQLREEVELAGCEPPPAIWARCHAVPSSGGNGVERQETFHLVRTAAFTPAGEAEELAREGVTEVRCWTGEEIAASDAALAPRRLVALLRDLPDDRPPAEPVSVGV